MGVEPTYAAWEAAVLPMNYSRVNKSIIADSFLICNTKNDDGMNFFPRSYNRSDQKGEGRYE